MDAQYFADLPSVWAVEAPVGADFSDTELIDVWYESSTSLLHFENIYIQGFRIREDGAAFYWWPADEGYSKVIRLDFSRERAVFTEFDWQTGAFLARFELVPK